MSDEGVRDADGGAGPQLEQADGPPDAPLPPAAPPDASQGPSGRPERYGQPGTSKGAREKARKRRMVADRERRLEQGRMIRAMVLGGAPVREAARQLGIPRSTAFMWYQEAIADARLREEEGVDHQIARLDQLIRALWTDALNGSVQASRTIGKHIDMQNKLRGWYPHPKVEVSGTVKVQPIASLAETTRKMAEIRAWQEAREGRIPFPSSSPAAIEAPSEVVEPPAQNGSGPAAEAG